MFEFLQRTECVVAPPRDKLAVAKQRSNVFLKWYQNKKDLLASIENLYSLFYSISKEERPMAEEEIDKTIKELIADEAE